jgi:hypothetical protein
LATGSDDTNVRVSTPLLPVGAPIVRNHYIVLLCFACRVFSPAVLVQLSNQSADRGRIDVLEPCFFQRERRTGSTAKFAGLGRIGVFGLPPQLLPL